MTRNRLIAVAVAALVALGAGILAGQSVVSSVSETPSKRKPAASQGVPAGFVKFQDDRARFSIAYPSSWRRLAGDESSGELLVTTPDRVASLLVRVAPLRSDFNPQALPGLRRLTERIVRSGNDVELLAKPERITLGTLPGYFYSYTFQGQAGSGRAVTARGAHLHYFLFQRKEMITLVFQTLPADGLRRFSPLFERMARTFRAGSA